MIDDDVRSVQIHYPQVWHACHRHEPVADGLTERDGALLAHLHDGGFARPAKLARHMGISASTLSEALDSLVERGLVERRRHAEDRRRVDFVLTPTGRDTFAAGSGLDGVRLRTALASLRPAERKKAVDGLRILAHACRAIDGGERR